MHDSHFAPTDSWGALSGAGRIILITTASIVALFHLTSGWIPILDDANLVFHEAGHPIFGLFGETLGLYGGTLGQLAFPLAAALTFYKRREVLGLSLAGLWFFENWLNIARYMADARTQLLPLVGGGEHDWALIFSNWNVLNQDTNIAGFVRFLAWMGLASTLYWAWFKNKSEQKGAS